MMKGHLHIYTYIHILLPRFSLKRKYIQQNSITKDYGVQPSESENLDASTYKKAVSIKKAFRSMLKIHFKLIFITESHQTLVMETLLEW